MTTTKEENFWLATALLSGVVLCTLLCIGSFVMIFVFSYVPALTYPDPIVNVEFKNATYGFYVRCDVGKDTKNLDKLLQDCGSQQWNIQPDCGDDFTYWWRVFSFGKTKCSTDYLSDISTTVNLNINLLAVASAMMIISFIIFAIPTICIFRFIFK